MTPSRIRGRLSGAATVVYGEPLVTPDGQTVIPVSRVHGECAAPLGVFVLNGERATWTAVIDQNRIAHIGVLTGLVAAALGSLAVLRRPPWPQTTVTITKSR